MGSDFEMIERGGGNGDLELGAFYLISSYNLLKMDVPAQMPYFFNYDKSQSMAGKIVRLGKTARSIHVKLIRQTCLAWKRALAF